MRDPRQEVPRRPPSGRDRAACYQPRRRVEHRQGGGVREVRRDGRRRRAPRRRSAARRPDRARHGRPARTAPARRCACWSSRRARRRRKPRPPAPTSSASSTSQKIKEGWLDFDVIVATPDVMGQLGAAGPRPRPPRPDAEPEGRHGHVGRRRRRCARSRRARSSSAWTRRGNVHAPIGKVSFALEAARRRTSRPSWTPSSAPSRRRPRACTSGRSPSPARWARASGSTRRRTGMSDETHREAAARRRADGEAARARTRSTCTDFTGLNVQRDDRAAPPPAQAGVEYVVIKNTLALRALVERDGGARRAPQGPDRPGRWPATDRARRRQGADRFRQGVREAGGEGAACGRRGGRRRAQVKRLAQLPLARSAARPARPARCRRRWPDSSER